MPTEQVASEAMTRLLTALAAAGGLGAAGRLTAGALTPARPPQTDLNPKLKPIVVDVPQPVDVSALRAAGPAAEKAAFDWKSFVEKNLSFTPYSGAATATAPTDLPWFNVGMAAGVPLAAVGGYAGLSKLLAAKRRADSKANLEAARKNYQTALFGKYHELDLPEKAAEAVAAFPDGGTTDPRLAKAASLLDELYALIKVGAAKRANEGPSLIERAFMLPNQFGPYGATAGLATIIGGLGLGGMLGYNAGRDRELIDQAEQAKKLVRSGPAPATPPVFARPVPVDAATGQPLDKATLAALGVAGDVKGMNRQLKKVAQPAAPARG